MNMQNIYRIFPLIFLLLTSCRGDEPVPAPREITVSSGFYLLNEGNKGNNMATLDYFDYTNNTYYLNIYAERNPTVVKELLASTARAVSSSAGRFSAAQRRAAGLSCAVQWASV